MSAAAAPAQPGIVQSAIALIAAPWSAQANWTVLDTGFADAHTFLALWQCWRGHSRRPAMLHYVGVLSLDQACALPALLVSATEPALATILARQCYDLEAGFHRLLLEDGHLSLTLCVGDSASMLARQDLQADSLVLAPPTDAHALPQDWDKWQIKALARCCKRGAQLLFGGPLLPPPRLLADAGFSSPVHGAGTQPAPPALAGQLQAVYDPRWQLRTRSNTGSTSIGQLAKRPGASAKRCAVVGAGIAGASVARALAVRGWAVDVYDALPAMAGGASGLPVGLVVPHHSADDSPRSRLSRHGTRLMLQHAGRLLQAGQDWSPSGVLELRIAPAGLADEEAELLSLADYSAQSNAWAIPMAYGDAQGLWHPHAAWIKPRRLVQQWLDHAGIRFHAQAAVHSLEQLHDGGQAQWLLRNAQGLELGRADQVVFANAYGCVDLLQRLADSTASTTASGLAWVPDVLAKLQAMQCVHGTLSYGPCPEPSTLPPFPVNGHGSFIGGVPTAQGPQWYAGSTFQSDAKRHADLAQEQRANLGKLQALLPAVAQTLSGQFAKQEVGTWQGSRCIAHDRLPLVGPLYDTAEPTLWLCAGMGARGLSFSALCAELLAAWLGGEPLPIENNLAKSLSTRRLRRSRALQPALTAD